MLRWSPGWLVLLLLAAVAPRLHGQTTPAKETAKPAEVTGYDAALEKLQQRNRELEAEKKALDDRLKLAEEKLRLNNRLPPSECALVGKVEGDYAQFQAHYRFSTFTANTWVSLGLQGAFLADEGKLDGQLPLLKASETGVEVYVEKPAIEHILNISFRVPVKVRRGGTASTSASERSLEFGLPGAAVNTLTIDLPNSVKELRANDFPATRKQPGRWTCLGLGPGLVERLKLAWKEPVTLPGTEAMLTADSIITVTVDDAQVETRAEMLLEDMRGDTKEWQLLLPAQLQAKDIKVETSGLLPEIVEPDEKNPFFILRFGESSRQSFKIRVHEIRGLEDARMLVGPFYLVGAYRQGGTIIVEKTATALQGKRLEFQRRPQIFGKASSNQPNILAEFQYSSLPRVTKAAPLKLRTDLALFDFQVKPDRGQYETQVEHQVSLQPSAHAWLATSATRIKVKSQSGMVGFVDVQLPRGETVNGLNVLGFTPLSFPANVPWLPVYLSNQKFWPATGPRDFICEQLDGPPPLMQSPDDQQRCRISLTGPPAREFTIVLTAEYRLPRETKVARLQLPAPLGSIDRGAKVSADIAEQYEFTRTGTASPTQRQRLEWESGRTPEVIELAWKPYIPEFPVSGIVDINIHDQHARIRQELRLPADFPGRDGLRSAATLFQIPPEIKSLPSAFFGFDAATRTASASLAADEVLVFEHSVSVPRGPGRTFAVPLIWPVKATRIEAKVRVWTPAGSVAQAQDVGAIWDSLVTEPVPDRDTLPGLVLRGAAAKLPLTLQVDEPAGAKVADLVCDRGLVEIRLEPNGEQLYRIRFLVQKINANSLTIAFPGRIAEIVPTIRLGDAELSWSVVDGETLQVQVSPELVSKPALLDLRYKLPAADSDNAWQTMLRLPRFQGDVLLGRIRWQVSTPKVSPEVTAFVLSDDAQVEYRWGLQNNWLPAPLPAATSSELEEWLTESASPALPGGTSLLFWRASMQPLRLWLLSQPLLFAICSSIFLLIGLGLHLAPLSRYSFWFTVALLGMMVVAAGMIWPSILPVVVFGCQPGVVILVLILTVQWMLHERYRRQLIFLPGFTRRKASSSIVKKGQLRREASTIDAPKGAQLSNAGQRA